ncbi:MAG: energy-coupling factor ABC transporter permease [Bryobacterales bacterium]|nr:energy-coupling factor ABC transporter permease [Bryobacterales bacterium]
MHVSDGILPVEMSIAGYVLALGAAVLTSRKLETEEVPRMGLLAAATFVASLVNVPVAGVSVHFGLFGLVGLLLGMRAVPVIFAVLILQTFLFQHGGFLSMGVNVVNMASGGLAAAAIGRYLPGPLGLRAALAGFAGIYLPVLLLLGEFRIAGYGRSILLLAGVYLVVGALEGVFTMTIVAFLRRAKPTLLSRLLRVPTSVPGALPQPHAEAR